MASGEPENSMRLQKFLARAGVASRRNAESLITAGRVKVNGSVVVELGSKVDAARDSVTLDDMRVSLQKRSITLMLHKPAGYLTTMRDPQKRPCVADLVPCATYPGLYPVGRLDNDTTGLLLFTTDGQLGNALIHPRKHVTKCYVAAIEGHPAESDIAPMRTGLTLSDGKTLPAEVKILAGAHAREAAEMIGAGSHASGGKLQGKRAALVKSKGITYIEIKVQEGRNRQIRRMFEQIGFPVFALHRSTLGPLNLGDLKRGAWRELTDKEYEALYRAIDVQLIQ